MGSFLLLCGGNAKGAWGALAYFVSRQSPPKKGARLALTLNLALSVNQAKSLNNERWAKVLFIAPRDFSGALRSPPNPFAKFRFAALVRAAFLYEVNCKQFVKCLTR